MISILTITYKRAHLLEEAIQSFLEQDPISGTEMVIINDNPEDALKELLEIVVFF
jgi:glycosyltransferase involved in cell wall biosynthesis